MATKITDFASTARLWQTVGPISTSDTSINGDSIDMIDVDGPAFAILAAVPASGSGSVSGQMQSSPDNSTWTDVPGASFPDKVGNSVRAITFQRPDRYLRMVLMIVNNDEDVAVSATIGESRKLF